LLYAVYRADGARPGEIQQANKVFAEDLKPYENLLGDLGHSFAKANVAGLLPPEQWYVLRGDLALRPLMQAAAQARMIKVGTTAVITGIPKGASVDLQAAGATVYSIAALDGDELEFPIPVPCTYRATIKLWPFQDCNIDIEAVA
jgi:hypothetical protein